MRAVNMDCGSLLPLLDRERFPSSLTLAKEDAESKPAASLRTSKRQPFQAEPAAAEQVPPIKISHPAFFNLHSAFAPGCVKLGQTQSNHFLTLTSLDQEQPPRPFRSRIKS